MNQSPLAILQQYWQHSTFRPQQEEIILAVLAQKDVLAILPTGGGKSVCFQVPALMRDGLCIVVSPLIALMKDQVENLRKKGIAAAALYSGMNMKEVHDTLNDASNGVYKFLYLSPERLETAIFREYLRHLHISLIAVDEAHCVSQWGYDFRPPYLRIAAIRHELPAVPVIALTASATPLVQDDIVDKLQLIQANIFRQSFAKPNLSYSVFKVDSKINKVFDILNNVPGSSIIYCRNRRLTKEVAHLLALQNITADFYHAGLSQDERSHRQEAWINNKTRVIVCTNAFGMGIDKADVKTVIHYDIPECLENYYQEAGRAGRDSKKAYAVLLYQQQDATALEHLPDVRFPVMYDIRKVYQSLADYLQVPVGSGEGCYYDFDLNEFVKNFKLDIHLVINTLKVLEQEGHLTFNESIFLPSQVKFLITKDTLLDFEQAHPALEEVIKCLLRTYEGVYDTRVSIHEKLIAKLTYKHVDHVKQQLLQLNTLGIIEYLPQKETPQIYFVLNRAPAQFLYINHENYLHRKQQFELRTAAMLRYLGLKTMCRSKHISAYFGDNNVEECGICDVCLQKKRSVLSAEEFKKIEAQILDNIHGRQTEVKTLLGLIKGVKKENIWKVLDFLQAEKKLIINEFGVISET